MCLRISFQKGFIAATITEAILIYAVLDPIISVLFTNVVTIALTFKLKCISVLLFVSCTLCNIQDSTLLYCDLEVLMTFHVASWCNLLWHNLVSWISTNIQRNLLLSSLDSSTLSLRQDKMFVPVYRMPWYHVPEYHDHSKTSLFIRNLLYNKNLNSHKEVMFIFEWQTELILSSYYIEKLMIKQELIVKWLIL
jgi:hypothetical protein